MACKQEHGLGVGPRLIRVIERFPSFVPVYCHNCTKTPGKDVCPAEAIFRNEQVVVLMNEGLCIGCKECMGACPLGVMEFDEDKEVAVKRNLYIERLENNEQAACSKACATRYIFRGILRSFLKG